jgi:hypothetical protein
MRKQRRGRLLALAVAAVVYLALGWGFHGLQSACYDSRHSIDHQPSVGGDLTPVIDTLLWPVWLPFSGGQSCEPAG